MKYKIILIIIIFVLYNTASVTNSVVSAFGISPNGFVLENINPNHPVEKNINVLFSGVRVGDQVDLILEGEGARFISLSENKIIKKEDDTKRHVVYMNINAKGVPIGSYDAKLSLKVSRYSDNTGSNSTQVFPNLNIPISFSVTSSLFHDISLSSLFLKYDEDGILADATLINKGNATEKIIGAEIVFFDKDYIPVYTEYILKTTEVVTPFLGKTFKWKIPIVDEMLDASSWKVIIYMEGGNDFSNEGSVSGIRPLRLDGDKKDVAMPIDDTSSNIYSLAEIFWRYIYIGLVVLAFLIVIFLSISVFNRQKD